MDTQDNSALIESEKTAFANVVELLYSLLKAEKYIAAAMHICNHLNDTYKCSRVSLGWVHNGYAVVEAMSNSDHFDKKSEAVQQLSQVMEESFDQNIEIYAPNHDDSFISKFHESYLNLMKCNFVYSFPLKIDNEPIGVITIERDTALTDVDFRFIRLICDLTIYRLNELKTHGEWVGRIAYDRLKKRVSKLMESEHVTPKLIAIGVSVFLLFFLLVPIPYRLNPQSTLKTDRIAYISAPFNGHIGRVNAKEGDTIKKGSNLLYLDRQELLLSRAETMAEINRQKREYEKAQAEHDLPKIQIEKALYFKSIAQLKHINYQLDKSVVKAPFNGVIIEGNANERQGARVEKGDILFKIAKLENLYIMADVNERDIYHISTNSKGTIVLNSRPQDSVKIRVQRIEPITVTKTDGNVFQVRCAVIGKYPDWWQPGMTGVCKLNAGYKPLSWIVLHRTTDFLRMRWWW